MQNALERSKPRHKTERLRETATVHVPVSPSEINTAFFAARCFDYQPVTSAFQKS